MNWQTSGGGFSWTFEAAGIRTPKTRWQGRRFLPALLKGVALVAAFAGTLSAQSLSLAVVQTVLPTSGLHGPSGVAVDAAGDVFIADRGNNRVVELPAGGGAQVTLPASGLSSPFGVAVDAAGDVFIADSNNNRVVKLPAGGGAQVTLPASGLSSPLGVAVDAAGAVFIADSNNNRVVELPAGGGAQITLPANGLSSPSGVAVDGAGDVFITDFVNCRLVELPAGGGAQITLSRALYDPTGVAADAVGDVFIADSHNNRVVGLPVGGGAQFTIPSSLLSTPFGVAVDAAGDVFVADTYNNRVLEVQDVSPSANVCQTGQTTPAPCSRSLTLTYNVTASGTLGAVKALAGGSQNLDFSVGTDTCAFANVAAGSTCSVNVIFTPRHPGSRPGALQIFDSAGNIVASTPLYGTGIGPQISYSMGPQLAVANAGWDDPEGVAVDGAGDVFIVDYGHNRVVELPAGGGAPITLPTSGLSAPYGVALDGAGDIFIADAGNNRVVELPAGGGAQITLPTSGLSYPTGVAVDGAGDVFIADHGNSQAVELLAGGGPQLTLPISGLNNPWDVAVDAAGNVFIADGYNNRVVKLPAGGGAQTTLPASGLFNPTNVKVDPAGDVFIADYANGRVVELPGSGGAQITVPANALGRPSGLGLDAAGDLFIADLGKNDVIELQLSHPPTLSFPNTTVGSTSSALSLGVQNIGNAPLTQTSLHVSTNFARVAGSGTPADCPAGASSLAAGAGCNISVVFAPTAGGTLNGTVVLEDNALNAVPYATQTIPLTGTGAAAAQTINFPTIPTQTVGTPLILSATATSGLPVSFGSSTTGVCTVAGTTASFIAAGTCSITASQAGNSSYLPASPVTQSFSVNAAAAAAYLGSDTTTQGTWTNKYGAQGQIIANDLNNPAPYASVALNGDTPYTWAASTTNVSALQTASGAATRIASTYYASTSFTIDLNLSDGNTHKISLYLLDWLADTRAETITIADAKSNAVLSTQSYATFENGVYAEWNISGHVLIKITKTAGGNAVLSGLFFDQAQGAATAAYIGSDTSTQGTWTGKYGAQGQIIANDLNNPAAYATVSLAGDTPYTWAASTTNVTALQTASGAATRIASTYYASTSFTIDLNLSDGNTHKISLYLLDWLANTRAETITISDAKSNAVLSTQSYATFENGVYAEWNISGHVLIKVTKTGGGNAVLSGIFFDQAQAQNPRVVWIPDFYGSLLQVRVGTTPTAITINLPSCNPNAVAVNNNKAYVVCNAYGANPDKILVYNATTIRAAAAGTLTIAPLQSITSSQFSSLIGITFDAANNLWVASYGNSQIDSVSAATLNTANPVVTASLINSPGSPVSMVFDSGGGLWVVGQYAGGILLHFPVSQINAGENATPDYCLASSSEAPGCPYVDNVFLSPEGVALYGGDVWVANNSTGSNGTIPGRELVDLKFSGGTLTVNAVFGSSGSPSSAPFVCPGGLYASASHLWVNDESYGETNPACGANGDVARMTGGVFSFTPQQLAAKTTTISQVLAFSNVTGRPGFGGIFVEND